MLTKPFVFVVQVVATIFGTEAAEYKSVLTDPSHGWKELHGIEIPLRGHRCLIEEAALSLVPTPTHAPNIGDVSNLGPSNGYKKPRTSVELQWARQRHSGRNAHQTIRLCGAGCGDHLRNGSC
ncbi:hypothetical protein MRX96_002984 [Rhipicephalus microplus]